MPSIYIRLLLQQLFVTGLWHPAGQLSPRTRCAIRHRASGDPLLDGRWAVLWNLSDDKQEEECQALMQMHEDGN